MTELKQSVCKDLNASSGVVMAQDSKSTQFKEIEERKRIAQYVTLQAREIEALKMELIMLKRKEAPQMMPYAAQQPSNASLMSQTMPNPATNSTVLPPINQKR